MKVILAEVAKVWRNRMFLSMLLVLLGVNLFCVRDTMHQEEYTPAEYRKAWQEIMEEPAGERLLFATEKLESIMAELKEAGLYSSKERRLYEAVVSELEAAHSYERFVEELGRKKDLITGSVLFRDADAFSTKSAEKAYREYGQASVPVIEEAPSKGVELVSLTVTDVLAACAGIFACVVLFVREREQDMVRLQWTLKRGREKHLWYKFGALFFCSIGIALVFYGCNYSMAATGFGFGPLGRDIRMVESYAHSVYGFSVGTWLVLNFVLKILVLFVMLLLCSVCCVWMNGMIRVVLSFTGILLLEYVLYSGIPATSIYSPFRYVNVIALFQDQEWLLRYNHIDVFGYPVNYEVCVAVMIGVVLLLAVTGCYFGYLAYGKKLEHRSRGRRKLKRKKHHTRVNLLGLEVWKGLIIQKLLPVVVGLLAVQFVYYARLKEPTPDIEEYYYKAYITALEGEITEETPQILNELYISAMNAPSSAAIDAYERVEKRYEYLKENGGCFVYDTGWEMLTGNNHDGRDAVLTIKSMLVVLLFCAALFSYDPQKRMAGLLHTTVNGAKKVPCRKYLIGVVFSILTAVAVYLPDAVWVANCYDMRGYDYPAVSLPWLSSYGHTVSLGGYITILYGVRFLLYPAVVVFVMMAAERLKSFVYTFFVCGVVLLCIPLLTMLNPSWIVLAYPLYGIYGNALLQSAWYEMAIYVAVVIGAVVLAIKGRKKLWN